MPLDEGLEDTVRFWSEERGADSEPLVTIGIPTRNRARLLERAVRSALAQEGVRLEIVVSDERVDGSSTTEASGPRGSTAHPSRRHSSANVGALVEDPFRTVLEARERHVLHRGLADCSTIMSGLDRTPAYVVPLPASPRCTSAESQIYDRVRLRTQR